MTRTLNLNWPKRSGFAWGGGRTPKEDTLEDIEKSRAARLPENRGQYIAMSHRTRGLLRRDRERYVRVYQETR